MLKTRCILRDRESPEEILISVMSRHTLNDGKTPHPRITPEKYDEWAKILAAPDELVGGFLRGSVLWEDFERRYLDYLKGDDVWKNVEDLAERGMKYDLVLLCVEDKPEHCHRRLLAEEAKRYRPDLELNIQ